MLIRRKKGWELPERSATPEAHVCEPTSAARWHGHRWVDPRCSRCLASSRSRVHVSSSAVPPHLAMMADEGSASLYPAPRNARYQIDRPLTAERLATTYNNFYEFGTHKDFRRGKNARVAETSVLGGSVDGDVAEREMTVDIDDFAEEPRSRSASTGTAASKPGR